MCKESSEYYSQCVPGTASGGSGGSPTTMQTSTTSAASGAGPTTAHHKWMGVDESGAEFGQQDIPGVYGTDFIFPDNNSLDVSLSVSVGVDKNTDVPRRLSWGRASTSSACHS
jgi:endoglucanase